MRGLCGTYHTQHFLEQSEGHTHSQVNPQAEHFSQTRRLWRRSFSKFGSFLAAEAKLIGECLEGCSYVVERTLGSGNEQKHTFQLDTKWSQSLT